MRSPNRSALLARHGEQALLGCGVRLDRAVGEDMAGRHAPLGERARDQQAAVAIERLALRAHQAQTLPPRLVDDPVETGAKRRGRRHRLVIGDAVAIERRIARPSAQRIAERQCR